MWRQPADHPKQIPIAIKICLFIWIGLVIFIFLVRFGPPEFWSVMERMGFAPRMYQLQNWLFSVFNAGYKS